MSNIRPGEQKFIDEWNKYTAGVDRKAIREPQVRHLLWMIANKDAIGNDMKTVRSKQTRVTNPYTQAKTSISNVRSYLQNVANANGFGTTPLEDKSTPPVPAPPAPAPVAPPAPPTNRDLQVAQEAKLPPLARSDNINSRETQATPSQRFNQQPGFSLTPVVPTSAPAGFKSTPDDIGKKKLTDLSLKEIKEYNDFQRPLPTILERQNTIYQTKLRQGLLQEANHPFGGKYNVTNESQINYNTNSKNPFIKAQARLEVKETDDTSRIYRPQLQEAIDDAKPSAKLLAKMANMEALRVEVPVYRPYKPKGFDPKELRPQLLTLLTLQQILITLIQTLIT